MEDLVSQYSKDRDKVLMNLDNENFDEIAKHCEKYGVPIPKDKISILAGLHKARLYVTNPEITDEMKQKSADWLLDRGFSLEIGGNDEHR